MKSKNYGEKVKSINVLNRNMEKIDLESRLPLEGIFHKLAEERDITVYGERKHARFSGWFYELDYNLWEMSKLREDELICYEDDMADVSFRHKLTDSEPNIPKLFMSYSIKTPYFEERIAFLRTLDNYIAKELTKHKFKDWLQGDYKKTFVSMGFSLPGLDEIFQFLMAHIKDTFERH